MTGALSDRVVLVTGGSRGIGAAIATRAAEEGASVAVNYNGSTEAANGVVQRIRAAGGTAEPFGADLREDAQLADLAKRVIDRFGRIDGLVNNAGITQVGATLELESSEWEAVIRMNLTTPFLMCQAVLPTMLKQGSGSIVNICSRLGQMGIAQTAAYSAAKAGL